MFKKPLLTVEIGGNHEGDFGKGKELVNMALECEVDFIGTKINKYLIIGQFKSKQDIDE
jgi:sialic acid synthase SpsE